MDLNHDTGQVIEGWAHVVQSLSTILATRLNTRVFRREFGSEVSALVDAPMNDAGLLALYVAVAEAIDRWEPRFELTNVQMVPDADGVITMTLIGNYRPNAHLGDFSTIANENQAVRVSQSGFDSWSLAA